MQRKISVVGSEKRLGQITLFSETDSHGTIVFANEAFCEVAKYSKEELLGKPHNVIRHPDMPKKLFKVLWNTIRSGKVFRGVIKNRAKDNSHYWVQAVIMPIIDNNNNVLRYTSIRHLIQDDREAEKLYAQQIKELSLA